MRAHTYTTLVIVTTLVVEEKKKGCERENEGNIYMRMLKAGNKEKRKYLSILIIFCLFSILNNSNSM
jgi:hypothetical protein